MNMIRKVRRNSIYYKDGVRFYLDFEFPELTVEDMVAGLNPSNSRTYKMYESVRLLDSMCRLTGAYCYSFLHQYPCNADAIEGMVFMNVLGESRRPDYTDGAWNGKIIYFRPAIGTKSNPRRETDRILIGGTDITKEDINELIVMSKLNM